MSTPSYKKRVHARDKETCQNCGSHGSRKNHLTVHHIKPKCLYPELERDIDNCVLLCQRCHTALHKKQGYPVPVQRPYERRNNRKKEKPKDRKRRLRREAKKRKRR